MSRPICANTTHVLKNIFRHWIQTYGHDLYINASTLSYRLVYEGIWATNRSIAFTPVLLSECLEKALTSIHVFLQIRQTYWCLCLTDAWPKSLQLIEDIEEPQTDKYKEITNDWKYDISHTLTLLPVWDLENFMLLIFFVQYRIHHWLREESVASF
jgi:hypothetical protein